MKKRLINKTIGIVADIITAVCSGITNFLLCSNTYRQNKADLGRRDRAKLYRHNKVSFPGSNARWKCDRVKRE